MNSIQEKFSLLQKPITKQDLYLYLFLATGENIPHQAVCPDHQTPWDLTWMSFFNRHPAILAIGPRKGGKTRSVAKIIFAEITALEGVEVANVGAIQKQAKKCYKYVTSFLNRACPDRVLRSVTEETILDNHAMYEQLVGTVSGVNSPHPSKLRADEVELMKRDVLEELLLVPTTDSIRNIPSNIILTSTRKYSYGLVQQLLDQRGKKGGGDDDDRAPFDFHPIIWCYKEIAEECPLERRGASAKAFVIPDIMNMDEAGHHPDISIKAWSNCGKCPLLTTCKGVLANSRGYLSIDDLIRDYTLVSPQTWIQQMECRRVSSTGKVYPQFDEAIHVGRYEFNPNLPLDVSVDFGYECPAFVGFFQHNEDTNEVFQVAEIYESHLTTDRLALRVHAILKEFGVNWDAVCYGVGDSEQAQQIADLKNHGIYLDSVDKGSVTGGLDIVRRYLHSMAFGVRFHINGGRCPKTIWEFKEYHYKRTSGEQLQSEEPVKKNDHAMDGIRYLLKHLERNINPGITILE